jgi:hypothetical protein
MRASNQHDLRYLRSRHRGIFMLDALLGLFLIVAIAAALGAVTSSQRRAAIIAANDRAAVRQAEATLILLQCRQPVQSDGKILRLDTPAPAGWEWVQATGRCGSRSAILVGLVPLNRGVK